MHTSLTTRNKIIAIAAAVASIVLVNVVLFFAILSYALR